MASQFRAARVHHDERGTPAGSVLDKGRRDGVVARRVGADHHNHLGMRSIFDLVGYRP